MVQSTRLPAAMEEALLREAAMSSMAIGTGLTQIRQYDFVRKGYFYSGLLSFTNGIERVMKIAMIYNYRLDHSGTFPDNKYIRDHSHNLVELLTLSREANTRHKLNINDSILDT